MRCPPIEWYEWQRDWKLNHEQSADTVHSAWRRPLLLYGLGSSRYVGMAKYLRGVPADVGTRPKAVVVISGHWEEKIATIPEQSGPTSAL